MPRTPSSSLPTRLVKGQLPTKICLTCGRPFEYRKKWRNSWDEVKYCGEKCQRNRPKEQPSAPTPANSGQK